MSVTPINNHEPKAWLIWSGEHQAWWRKNARGYSLKMEDAGRYSRSDADAYVCFSGLEKRLEIIGDPNGPFKECSEKIAG